MPKARTSLLVFKGPANPSGRIRKPPSSILVDSAPKKSSTTVVRKKKKPAISLALSDEEEEEEVIMSDKKKGKRKAVEEPAEEIRPSLSNAKTLKVSSFESSIALTTVEKTWKPLSDESRTELLELAKQIEGLMSHLEYLKLPPFPATLKPRSTGSASSSKNSIDLVDSETVKKKIETTRTSLQKEEKLIRDLEEELKELKDLKRARAIDNNDVSSDQEEGVDGEEAEEEEDLVVLPLKKKKKVVTIESKPTSPSTSRPKAKSKSKTFIPHSSSTNPPQRSKSILKPNPLPPPRSVAMEDDSDDFDTFPLPPPKTKPFLTKKAASLAGKKKE
ncbi:hypothetical protein JCM3765_001120 [Sporobolomyces pararoseus]